VIVALSALPLAARSVAEKLGIPYVFAAYAPGVLAGSSRYQLLDGLHHRYERRAA
jgi:hypothetical protein